jgi:hypothetical protein
MNEQDEATPKRLREQADAVQMLGVLAGSTLACQDTVDALRTAADEIERLGALLYERVDLEARLDNVEDRLQAARELGRAEGIRKLGEDDEP